MYIIGYIALLAGLLISVAAGGLALSALWNRNYNDIKWISRSCWAVAGCFLLASAILLHALFWEDYRLEYVAAYTDSLLPVFYRLTAFWAGQPGSLLFWGLFAAISGCIWQLTKTAKKTGNAKALWFWLFFYANTAFFCLLLTSFSNPFIILNPAPADGQGLNPLLQNSGMIFHPPLLFIGYALFTPPACLGLAELVSADTEIRWFNSSRIFIILAWLFLSAGILIGAWWAYMELGWGGYWGWDPVENASLLPWLAATAAIHVLIIQRKNNSLERTSVVLVSFTLILAFFATYLTRSGVVQSVHAFGDGGVGIPLLTFVCASVFITLLAAFCHRPKGSPLANPVSREGSIILMTWLFAALTIIIMAGTLWPVITHFVSSQSAGLEASFYNRVCLPLASIIIFLLAICPWQGFRNGLREQGMPIKFIIACGIFIAAGFSLWLAGYTRPVALFASAAAASAIFGIFSQIKSGIKTASGRAAFGAHLGIALITLGIAFSGPYTTDREMLLSVNSKENIGPYLISLESVKEGEGKGYDFLQANIKISKNGIETGILKPERRIYAKFGSMQFSEVDVISTWKQDIYASLLGMDEDQKVLVKISIEPLVSWIWIGSAILCLVPLLGLSNGKKE